MPGGELRVTIENREAVLEGPVEQICAGTTRL
jgi:diaminopimelate epimerase